MEHRQNVSDEQLNDILDDLADPVLVAQAQRDRETAARLAAMQHADAQLQARLQRWDCPPAQQLADYHWGLVDRSTAQTIARHVETCVRCTEEIATLRAFLDADVPHVAAPPPAPTPHPRPSWLRPWIATIVPRAPAMALRGAGGAPIVAEAGDVTVVLDTQAADDEQIVLVGQVAADPDRWTGALVEIRQNGTVRATAEVDDLGSFHSNPLPAVISELRITAPDGVSVVVPQVDLGDRG